MNERIETIVSGRVQVVMYRDFATRKARGLGLVGEVKNLPDGTVRVVAEGARTPYVRRPSRGTHERKDDYSSRDHRSRSRYGHFIRVFDRKLESLEGGSRISHESFFMGIRTRVCRTQ